MMPLLPGFAGDVTQSDSGVLRVQMQIQFEAISRHKDSSIQILEDYNHNNKKNIKVTDYLNFVGLRNHSKFQSVPAT